MASNRFPDNLDQYQAELTEEEREEIAAASVALDLARMVYAAREARGLTQTKAAELTGVRQQDDKPLGRWHRPTDAQDR
jgi:hypothetical protein